MNQEEGKPTMLNAEQVAQRLNMSKGFACKIIDYFTAFATPFQTSLLQCSTVG